MKKLVAILVMAVLLMGVGLPACFRDLELVSRGTLLVTR